MEKVLFREVQKFRQVWLWLLMLFSFGIPLVIIASEMVIEIKTGSDERFLLAFIFLFLLVIGSVLVWLFLKMKLEVEIRAEEIRFRYPPMMNKWKNLRKTEIERFEVRQYKPVAEYGGWGIKSSWKKRNIAYNVSGNIGLQLYLKNGNKILIGTELKYEIGHAMGRMMKEEN